MSDEAPAPVYRKGYILDAPGCPDCATGKLQLRHGRYGWFFGCTRYTEGCRGTHPAEQTTLAPLPDVGPMDAESRAARERCHLMFDKLWNTQKTIRTRKVARQNAYQWLRTELKLTNEEAHIRRFDAETCERVIALVEAKLAAEKTP